MRTHAPRRARHVKVKPSIKPSSPAVEYFKNKIEFDISPYSLKDILDSNPAEVVVVDVRNPEAYAEAHIPGARSIPLDGLAARFAELPRDKAFVTYCADIACTLSSKAALEFARKGFSVKHLVGGIAEWSRKGYPIQSAQSAEGEGGPME